MSKNLEQIGLKSIVSQYDLFFIDIWGVIHNGIKLHENAVKVLEELSKNNKKFILLTNAPRPNLTVINTLKRMGLNKFSETVFTSGEASLRYILEKFKINGIKNCQIEGKESGDWKLIDGIDVIVHIFNPEKRKFYELEKMWSELIPKERILI